MSEADDRWAEGLAGRGGEADAATIEARELRAGLLARVIDAEPEAPREDPAREAALVARARREGLIPTPFWDRRRVVATLAAAASLVIAVALFTRAPREPEATRGAPAGIVRLESADPASLQRRIAEELRGVGVEATTYERLGRYGVDADLPAPIPPELLEVLGRHALPVPTDGVLTVEIVQERAR